MPKRKSFFNLVGSITAFEEGKLGEKETLRLFQHLVNTGQAWHLQGFYGRTAMNLLQQGLIKPPRKQQKDYYGTVIKFPKRKRM